MCAVGDPVPSLQEADENGSDGLDIDEFKAAFGQILGKGKKDQQVHTHTHTHTHTQCRARARALCGGRQ